MRKESIEPRGINRISTPLSPVPGAMEELINLRYYAGHIQTVSRKKIVFRNKNYSKVHLHSGSGFNNLIASAFGIVYRISFTGTIIQTIHSTGNDVMISSIGNLLILNSFTEKSLRVYSFNNGTYSLLFSQMPPAIKINYTLDTLPLDSTPVSRIGINTNGDRETRNVLMSMLHDCRTQNKERAEGYILLSANYTLFDGSETKLTPPKLITLGGYDTTPFMTALDTNKFFCRTEASKLAIELILPNLSQYRDIIKAVNLYTSSVISAYDTDPENITGIIITNNDITSPESISIKKKLVTQSLFENILFYRQKIITIDQLTDNKYNMVFDMIETGKTMDVDSSGWVDTVGKPYVYNSRLHLYDYKKTIVKENIVFEYISSVETPTPPEPTTTTTTTTQPPETYDYFAFYGFGDTQEQAYNNGLPNFSLKGILYLFPDGNYYLDLSKQTYAPNGYYLLFAGTAWNTGSIYRQVTTSPTTTQGSFVPALNIVDPYNITKNVAYVDGQITFEGSTPVIQKGICWSTSPNPTILDNKTESGSGGGAFTGILTGLIPNTLYYVRAYGTNSNGTGYSIQKTFATMPESSDRQSVPYFGYNIANMEIAFFSEIEGIFYLDNDGKYYDAPNGGVVVSMGYYMINKGDSYLLSTYVYYNGTTFIIIEPTTTTTSTTTTTQPPTYIQYYAAYNPYPYADYVEVAKLANWTTQIPLYSPNNTAWYFNSQYTNVAEGMFVREDDDQDFYYWFQIVGGTIIDTGVRPKSELTTTTTTTQPPAETRTKIDYLGFSPIDQENAYSSGIDGSIYQGDTSGIYYAGEIGSALATNGYYLITDNGSWQTSLFIHISQ